MQVQIQAWDPEPYDRGTMPSGSVRSVLHTGLHTGPLPAYLDRTDDEHGQQKQDVAGPHFPCTHGTRGMEIETCLAADAWNHATLKGNPRSQFSSRRSKRCYPRSPSAQKFTRIMGRALPAISPVELGISITLRSLYAPNVRSVQRAAALPPCRMRRNCSRGRPAPQIPAHVIRPPYTASSRKILDCISVFHAVI